jgi:hypothetical protein
MKKLLLLLGVFLSLSFSAFSQHSPEVKIIKTGIDPTNIVDYDINMDFNIKAIAAGVCFGETDQNNFFMWQINTELGYARFRPHSWTNGGGACHAEIDISSIVDVKNDVTYAYRIEIRGDKASTYINNILVDADRVNPRGAGVNYGYANLGIREDKAENIGVLEQASYDNMKVTSTIDGTLTTLFEENFSDPTNFLFSTGSVVDGSLVVVGRSYSWQIAPSAYTVYTIKMDVEIKDFAAGPCFGVKDDGNFFMWQLNVENGRSYFRPHTWLNGGGAVVVENDISSLIAIQKDVVYTLRIEINGEKASTYVNNILIDADRINPLGNRIYGYGKLGFRESHNPANEGERAYFDNVVVTTPINGVETTLYSNRFSGSVSGFTIGDVVDGRLFVSSPGPNDIYSWQNADIIEIPTAVQPVEGKKELSIYPNPVKDVLTISTSSVDYQICNLIGKQIQTGKGSTLNVADFADGVYLIRVGNKISKFVKN